MINYLLQIVSAALGTLGLVTMIGAPERHLKYCSAIGACTWGVYYALYNCTNLFSEPVSTLMGTAVGIMIARYLAVREKCPVTVFLISAIFPLVPGAGIFWTTFYFSTNQMSLAGTKGFLALKLALAIVLGIVIVFEIPQSFFTKLVKVLHGKKEN